jgi:hypothetical protein
MVCGLVTPEVPKGYSGAVAILGGGRSVWEDHDRAVALGINQFIAVNDIGMHYHGVIQHWCSLHPTYFGGWVKYREAHTYGAGKPFLVHAQKNEPRVSHVWAKQFSMSGTFAIQVALVLGYSKVVLCGIRMDNGGHYFDHPNYTTYNDCRVQFIELQEMNQKWCQNRVKSFGGMTARIFGEPDKAWLAS